MTKKNELTYEKAWEELQEIHRCLENQEVTVDDLPETIKKANQLLLFCKTKLRETEKEVSKLMGGNPEA